MLQKVKHYKFINRYLPIFLFLFVCFPINVKADQIGVGSVWDGTVNISADQPIVYLNADHDGSYNDYDGLYPTYNYASYRGDSNFLVKINSNSDDVYLNGYIRKRVRVQKSSNYSHANVGYLTVTSDPILMDNLYITTSIVSRFTNADTVFDIYIYFDNYFVNNSEFVLPLYVHYDLDIEFATLQSSKVPGSFLVEHIMIDDYAGDVMQYDRLDDVPSMDGYFAEQNTDIINNTTINNDLLEQQIQQDHEDTIQQTDTLTNGFDNSAGNASADRLQDNINNLESSENSLFGNVSDANEDYTDITDFFTNVQIIESFSFVKSIMESIYEAMDDFAVPISVAFLFIVVTRIIGFQQFSSGGG